MNLIRLFTPVLVICLGIGICSTESLSATFSIASETTISVVEERDVRSHTVTIEIDGRQDGCTIENGVLRCNRSIASLFKFDALRATYPVIIVLCKSNQLPMPSWQGNNTFYKDYIRKLLPQKKPEEN